MWLLSQSSAQLSAGAFVARVDVARPDEGLSDVMVRGRLFDGARLLCVMPRKTGDRESLLEAYVRGADLVATYGPSATGQVRPEIYYRALAEASGVLGGVEIIVSAQTSLLGVDPSLGVESLLPVGEVLVLKPSGRFNAADVPATIERGPGVFLLRPRDVDWSYLEMVFPSDFSVARVSADATGVRVANNLFPEQLEKGVIRRGRLRGLFLNRADDDAAAHALYGEFAASPTPLTT